jgi:hypothetical protein
VQDITFATRIFDNHDPASGITHEVKDRMVRKPCGQFYLIEGPDKPGGPEVVKPYSLQAVYDWYQDCPEQIERAVIMGGGTAELAERPRAGRRETAGPLALTVARRQGESQNATV